MHLMKKAKKHKNPDYRAAVRSAECCVAHQAAGRANVHVRRTNHAISLRSAARCTLQHSLAVNLLRLHAPMCARQQDTHNSTGRSQGGWLEIQTQAKGGKRLPREGPNSDQRQLLATRVHPKSPPEVSQEACQEVRGISRSIVQHLDPVPPPLPPQSLGQRSHVLHRLAPAPGSRARMGRGISAEHRRGSASGLPAPAAAQHHRLFVLSDPMLSVAPSTHLSGVQYSPRSTSMPRRSSHTRLVSCSRKLAGRSTCRGAERWVSG